MWKTFSYDLQRYAVENKTMQWIDMAYHANMKNIVSVKVVFSCLKLDWFNPVLSIMRHEVNFLQLVLWLETKI